MTGFNQEIKVLDKGYVRLVDFMGNDMSVVRAARVSYDAEPRNDGRDERLIHYLIENDHTSPFEHVAFTFEVKAPIFVFREWHRHRTWSYNEVSARYTRLPDEWYVPDSDKIGIQSGINRQQREFATTERPEVPVFINNQCTDNSDSYNDLLSFFNVPREVARNVMTVNWYSKMFATVDLLNLLKFLKLRQGDGAQWEIKQYANALEELVTPIVPVSIKAFKENNKK